MNPEHHWTLRKDLALAWLRVGFALAAVIVIQLNPSRVARFPALSTFSLVSFLFYSVFVLFLEVRSTAGSWIRGVATTCLDLTFVSLIVFSTGGTRTPFFFYYSFPVITASTRWGIKASVLVAVIAVALYGGFRLTLAAEGNEPPIGIDVLIIRTNYLLVLACIFGVLSEVEQQQNRRLITLSKTAGEVATLVERRRIMHDLHDGLLQSLATQILRLETCRKHLLTSPRELDGELRALEEETRSSMKIIRRFLRGQEVQSFLSGSLLRKLREDLRFLQEGAGVEVILETVPEDLSVPEELEQEIYYVLREALMNVARHAQASRVKVTLRQGTTITLKETGAEIRGSVTDDGIGFEPDAGRSAAGVGLSSMRERVKKIGGELRIESAPGSGTTLSFVVPVDAPAEPQSVGAAALRA
jgi:signal transduction histidine kinase